MKLLLDQALPYRAAAYLTEHGIDALHVRDIGYAAAEDEVIIAKARVEARVIVTYDADFHALIALTGADSPSVIRIRIEGLNADTLTELVLWAIPQCASHLEGGALVTVRGDRIRVRKLPVVRK